MVGDQHERPLGIGISGLRHDVPGRPVGQHRPAEPAPAVAEVVPQRRGADPGDGRGDRAGSALLRLRSARTPPAAATALTSPIGHQ